MACPQKIACAQKNKRRRKPKDSNENEQPLAPMELRRIKAMKENNAKLAALGLEDLASVTAAKRKREEEAKAKRGASKHAKIVSNWTSLCRVGTRVKVPAETFQNVVPRLIFPEVRATLPHTPHTPHSTRPVEEMKNPGAGGGCYARRGGVQVGVPSYGPCEEAEETGRGVAWPTTVRSQVVAGRYPSRGRAWVRMEGPALFLPQCLHGTLGA